MRQRILKRRSRRKERWTTDGWMDGMDRCMDKHKQDGGREESNNRLGHFPLLCFCTKTK